MNENDEEQLHRALKVISLGFQMIYQLGYKLPESVFLEKRNDTNLCHVHVDTNLTQDEE